MSLSTIIISFMFIFSINTFTMQDRVVYGIDDRIELSTTTNQEYLRWGMATLVQVSKSSIYSDGSFQSSKLENSYGLCSDQKFLEQPTLGRCTGFLIAPDVLVTAGHCVNYSFHCSGYNWVLDYQEGVTHFDSSKIFNCSEVIIQEYKNNRDYAVIRLDRKVEDRDHFEWNEQDDLNVGDALVIIGNPSGLPTKIDDGAVVKNIKNKYTFEANLDAFGGNSGSPVINSVTGKVEGILVRGNPDYETVSHNGNSCRKVKVCDDLLGCNNSFEDVMRLSDIPLAQIFNP